MTNEQLKIWCDCTFISTQTRPLETVGKDADELYRLWSKTKNPVYQTGILFECGGLIMQRLYSLWKTVPELREDLYQTGILALCQAMEKFNIRKKVKFSTFAYSYIKGGILLLVQENNLFGTRRAGVVLHKVKQAMEILEQNGQAVDEQSVREMLRSTSFTGDVQKAMEYIRGGVISCSFSLPADELDRFYIEPADPHHYIEEYENREAVVYCLSKIPNQRDRIIFWQRYGLGFTIAELAQKYQLSRQRISTICKESKKRIQEQVMPI